MPALLANLPLYDAFRCIVFDWYKASLLPVKLKGANPNMTGFISFLSADSPNSPILDVTSGLHQGSSLTLDGLEYTIGSTVASDLMLSDAGIAELHLRLRFDVHQVAIEALGGEVMIIQGAASDIVVPKGSGYRARLPLLLRIGAARMLLSCPDIPKPSALSRRMVFFWMAVVALLVIFGAVLGLGNRAPTTQGVPITNRYSAASGQSRIDAKAWFEEQLKASNFTGVKVSNVDGHLSAVGSLDLLQKPKWIALQEAFDKRYGQQVVLDAKILLRSEAARPRVRFQAVWFGANPYVINDSGKRQYPGAVLDDGWVLQRIEKNQITLVRGEERFTFTL